MYKIQSTEPIQPREKLNTFGAENLNDAELMAVLLGSGIKGKSVHVLAKEVIHCLDINGFPLSQKQLVELHGMGQAKATMISAAFELARRFCAIERSKVRGPEDIFHGIHHYGDRPQEHFLSVILNGAHEILKIKVVSVGLLNRTLIHPREVFADAIAQRAAAIVVGHNHPSGSLDPSAEDIDVTKRLQEAGELLGIPLLDHIIFSTREYYSFSKNGKL